jgi:hypothetical protein
MEMDNFEDDPKVKELKIELSQKNLEIQQIVEQFNSMH